MTVSRLLQAIVITTKKILALLNQIILCYDKEKTLELNEADILGSIDISRCRKPAFVVSGLYLHSRVAYKYRTKALR